MAFAREDDRSHGESYPGGTPDDGEGRQPQQPDQPAQHPPGTRPRQGSAGGGVSGGEPSRAGEAEPGPLEAVDKALRAESGPPADSPPAGRDPRLAPSDAMRSRPVDGDEAGSRRRGRS